MSVERASSVLQPLTATPRKPGILHAVEKVTDVRYYFSDSQSARALDLFTKGKMFSAQDYIQVRKLFSLLIS